MTADTVKPITDEERRKTFEGGALSLLPQIAIDLVQRWEARLAAAEAENARLREALKRIHKGKGAFDPDPRRHALNTVRKLKEVARTALSESEAND